MSICSIGEKQQETTNFGISVIATPKLISKKRTTLENLESTSLQGE